MQSERVASLTSIAAAREIILYVHDTSFVHIHQDSLNAVKRTLSLSEVLLQRIIAALDCERRGD